MSSWRRWHRRQRDVLVSRCSVCDARLPHRVASSAIDFVRCTTCGHAMHRRGLDHWHFETCLRACATDVDELDCNGVCDLMWAADRAMNRQVDMRQWSTERQLAAELRTDTTVRFVVTYLRWRRESLWDAWRRRSAELAALRCVLWPVLPQDCIRHIAVFV